MPHCHKPGTNKHGLDCEGLACHREVEWPHLDFSIVHYMVSSASMYSLCGLSGLCSPAKTVDFIFEGGGTHGADTDNLKVITRVTVDMWKLKFKRGSSVGSGILYTPRVLSLVPLKFAMCKMKNLRMEFRIALGCVC